MQPLGNNGYTAAQVLQRFTGSDRAWAFPVRVLDYKFHFLRYLPAGVVSDAAVTYDPDSRPFSGVYGFTLKAEAAFDFFNEYIQPEVWLWMGTAVPNPASHDGDKFAKFRQWIFRVTSAHSDLGPLELRITAHDAISVLLNEDQIVSGFSAQTGESIVNKIAALLAASPLLRWNVAPSDQTFSKPRDFDPPPTPAEIDNQAILRVVSAASVPAFAQGGPLNVGIAVGTSFGAALDGLCAELHYIRLPDESGVLNIGPWRDPAVVAASIAYTDAEPDTILRDGRLQRDAFDVPNHLTLRSVAQEDGTFWERVAENKSVLSPVSQVNLKAPNGGPLVRHRVEKDVEAASAIILQEKANRRLLELSEGLETYEMRSRLKPYHHVGDVVAITRVDAGYSGSRFQVKKIIMPLRHDAEQQMTLVRSIALQ